jgi:hypothetical protein
MKIEEATETEIVVSPGAEITKENSEPLEFLKELISDGINRAETLKRQASTAIVDLAETAIRTGFYLSDAKTYIAGERGFVKWIESNFSLSYARAAQLKRLSKFFARDLIDLKQREKLGISPRGLEGVISGEHLRNQIKSIGPKSLSDLFRICDILPPLAIQAPTNRNGNGDHPASPAPRLQKFEILLAEIEKKAKAINPDRLTLQQRQTLLSKLKPMIAFYSTLKNFE